MSDILYNIYFLHMFFVLKQLFDCSKKFNIIFLSIILIKYNIAMLFIYTHMYEVFIVMLYCIIRLACTLLEIFSLHILYRMKA